MPQRHEQRQQEQHQQHNDNNVQDALDLPVHWDVGVDQPKQYADNDDSDKQFN
jgi:hypothetical protein